MASRVIPIKKLISWSFSRYSDYKRCPLATKYKHIDKIQEPKNAAMERGAMIHTFAEDFIKGKSSTLAPELLKFKGEFSALRRMFKKENQSMVVEDNWAFTGDWSETTWNDWANCWVRIKLDCAHHDPDRPARLYVKDWKSGKFRSEQNEEYVEQLELYALAALILHEHVEEVVPLLAYTDEGRWYPSGEHGEEFVIFDRSDIPRLKKTWEKRTRAMMNDTTFAPRPNDKCKWCFYGQSGKARGGPNLCKY